MGSGWIDTSARAVPGEECTLGVRQPTDDGAGGSGLLASRPSIGSGRSARDTTLEFNWLPGVWAFCDLSDKLGKDKQLTGERLARPLSICGRFRCAP